MAAIDENVLIANGVAPSKGNNELHCWICPIELDYDNWKAHINDPSHVSALRQFNRVFVANGDKIRCKACNMIFDWEALRNHAAWHRIIPWYVNEDRDKIFFDNRMLRWESCYYCFLCDAIFADWTNASVHIGEEKHQNLITLIPPVMDSFEPVGTSHDSLISEGFVPWGKTTVKCRICNCPNIILRNIAQHIEACEHVNAKLILTKKLETRGTNDAPEISENSNDGKMPGNQMQCAELQEIENSGTRYNSQQSPQSIPPVIDNESSEKPINPEKSDQMKFQSQISRSPSLTSSSELLSSSDCHETTSEPVTKHTTDLSSDGNPRFRSASNCEIRRKSVDSEADASTKNECAELQEIENSGTRYNSQQSPQSIPSVIDNESSEKPINPEKSDQMKFQSQISRSPSLTSSCELLSSSDCHETTNKPLTKHTTDLSSDGNPRFRSASNCEIGRKSVDSEADASTKNECAELQEIENSGTRYNSQQSPQSIPSVIDNESSEKPINPEKSDQMKFQSQISRSPSLTSSCELLSSSNCHETTNKPLTKHTTDLSSDGNPRFRSASNCEIRRKSVDSEADASTKNECAELQEIENSGTRYNSQQSPQSIPSVIDNESSEKPINPEKSDQMKFQSQISRSPSLTSSNELLSSSDCHETTSEPVTKHTTDLSSDENPRFRSASNCEIRRISVDSEADASTKNHGVELQENENSKTRHNRKKPSQYSQDSQKLNTDKFKDTKKNLNGTNVKIPSNRDPSNFPVESTDVGRYCIVCDIYISETIDEHVASEKHLSLFHSLGHEFISPLDGVKFRCKACCYIVSSIEKVYLHIKDAKHRRIITEERKKTAPEAKEIDATSQEPEVSQNATKSKKTYLEMNFRRSFEPIKKSAAAYVVKYNSHDFFCRLCNEVVFDVILNYHLKADVRHETASIMFKADFIVENTNVFRCQPCKLVIYDRDSLYHHVHTPAHRMTHIEGCRLLLTDDVLLCLDNEPLEQYSKSTDRSNNWIVNLNRRDYVCKICHRLLSDHLTIGEHLNSPRHISWVAFYANKEPLEDEKFDCESCDCAIPNFADVFEHTMSTAHNSSMRFPIKKFSSLELTDRDRETLRRAFIAPMNNVAYICRICNVYLEDYSSVEGHTRSDLHTKTFIKYGCEKMNLVTANKSYYCAWCRSEISALSRVYTHLVARRHRKNLMQQHKTIPNDLGESIENQEVTKIISPVMGSASSEKPINPKNSEEMTYILLIFLLIALYLINQVRLKYSI